MFKKFWVPAAITFMISALVFPGCAMSTWMRPIAAEPTAKRVITHPRGQSDEQWEKDKQECTVEADQWADEMDHTGRTVLFGIAWNGGLTAVMSVISCSLMPQLCLVVAGTGAAFIFYQSTQAAVNGSTQGTMAADLTVLADRKYTDCMELRDYKVVR